MWYLQTFGHQGAERLKLGLPILWQFLLCQCCKKQSLFLNYYIVERSFFLFGFALALPPLRNSLLVPAGWILVWTETKSQEGNYELVDIRQTKIIWLFFFSSSSSWSLQCAHRFRSVSQLTCFCSRWKWRRREAWRFPICVFLFSCCC